MSLNAINKPIQDGSGNLMAGASVEFRQETDGALVALYSDAAGTTSVGNPYTTIDGIITLWTETNKLKITATLGSTTNTQRGVIVGMKTDYVDNFAADISGYVTDAEAAADRAENAEANAQSSARSTATWTEMLTLTGAEDGQGSEVLDSDTGTHLAASSTGYNGASVSNSGRYSWDSTWTRWVRIGDTGLAGKLGLNEFADFYPAPYPSVSNKQMVGYATFVADSTETRPAGTVIVTDTQNAATQNCALVKATAQVQIAVAAQPLQFYGIRPNGGDYTVVWKSPLLDASAGGLITWIPDVIDRPAVQIGDLFGYYSFKSGGTGVVASLIAGAPTQLRWGNNGPISVGAVINSSTAGWSESEFIPVVEFTYDTSAEVVAGSWVGENNGVSQLDTEGRTAAKTLPKLIQSSYFSSADAGISSSTDREFGDITNFEINTEKEVRRYHRTAQPVIFDPSAFLGGTGSVGGVFGDKRLHIYWDTANPGLSEGLLTRIRINAGGLVVAGNEGTAKIQMWVVRPRFDLATAAEDQIGYFDLVHKIAEIPAEPVALPREVVGLGLPVEQGDLIAYRFIGCGFPFGGGNSAPTILHTTPVFDDDLSINALDKGFGAVINQGTLVDAEYEVLPGNALTGKGALPYLYQGRVDHSVLPISFNRWKDKKILASGTSITRGTGASANRYGYIARAGQMLQCFMDNAGVGGQGAATRNNKTALANTVAEFIAFDGSDGSDSYENRILGKFPDLFIWDHGFNDQGLAMGTIDSVDRSTYLGAANFIIGELRNEVSYMQMVFTTPISLYGQGNGSINPDLVEIRDANIALAAKYNSPLLDFSKLLCIDETNHTETHDDPNGYGAHPLDAVQIRAAYMLHNFLLGV
jgi:hypothetical protein